MYTLKKLTKVRPLKSSVMSSTPPVAPKLCIETDFLFLLDCRHHTQIPLIFWEKELIYTFSPYTSSLNKQLCMWQKNKTSLGESPTNPKLMTHSVVNLVTSQYFMFLSFFPALFEGTLMSVNNSIQVFPTPLSILVMEGHMYIFIAREVLLLHFGSCKDGLKTAYYRARTHSFSIMQLVMVYFRWNEY